MKRPARPCGTTIAIIAAAFLYSLLPLFQVGLMLAARQRFLDASGTSEVFGTIATGVEFTGVTDGAIALQVGLALAFLVVAALTWRGRPAQMRWVFPGAVVLLTLVKLAAVLHQAATPRDLQAGLSSGDTLAAALNLGQLVIELLVTVYVVWYLNRGPARAFFRGYYLRRPPETARDELSQPARSVEL